MILYSSKCFKTLFYSFASSMNIVLRLDTYLLLGLPQVWFYPVYHQTQQTWYLPIAWPSTSLILPSLSPDSADLIPTYCLAFHKFDPTQSITRLSRLDTYLLLGLPQVWSYPVYHQTQQTWYLPIAWPSTSLILPSLSPDSADLIPTYCLAFHKFDSTQSITRLSRLDTYLLLGLPQVWSYPVYHQTQQTWYLPIAWPSTSLILPSLSPDSARKFCSICNTIACLSWNRRIKSSRYLVIL